MQPHSRTQGTAADGVQMRVPYIRVLALPAEAKLYSIFMKILHHTISRENFVDNFGYGQNPEACLLTHSIYIKIIIKNNEKSVRDERKRKENLGPTRREGAKKRGKK